MQRGDRVRLEFVVLVQELCALKCSDNVYETDGEERRG